jgi:hypothetical protein
MSRLEAIICLPYQQKIHIVNRISSIWVDVYYVPARNNPTFQRRKFTETLRTLLVFYIKKKFEFPAQQAFLMNMKFNFCNIDKSLKSMQNKNTNSNIVRVETCIA